MVQSPHCEMDQEALKACMQYVFSQHVQWHMLLACASRTTVQ